MAGAGTAPEIHPLVMAYPNPLINKTTLEYTLTQTTRVSIHLLDLQGKEIDTYMEQEQQIPGKYRQALVFSETLPGGVYYVRLTTEQGQKNIQVIKTE